jgi:curli production assembly/transport component CsgF
MRYTKSFMLITMIAGVSSSAFATPIIYSPTNPSFGGSPMNASALLSSAQVSRPKEATADDTLSASQQIANQIQSSVLAQVSTSIASQIYGDNAQDSGSFNLGDGASIVFNTVGNDVVLVIHGADGTNTQLILPKSTITF